MSPKTKFLNIWWLAFKYLVTVMLIIFAVRAGQLFLNDDADSVTVYTVFTGLAITVLGAGLVTAIIAWAVIQVDKKSEV